MKRIYFIVIVLLSSSITLVAQQDQIDQLIKGSKDDANYLVEGYMAPLLKSVTYGLNQGWYNTAKPHKFPGFDLTVSFSLVKIPTSDYFYTVDNSKLTKINHVESDGVTLSTKQVPTFLGPETAPKYNYKGSPSSITSFDGPPGLDLKGKYGVKSLPIPIANIGIGLPKGFDLKVRYVPTLDVGSGSKFGMFGVGLMHDVKQYIPGIKNLPFDLSGFVGYTRMTTDIVIDAAKNQNAKVDVSATTIQGLISKKIAVLTVYGGLGYNMGSAKLKATGTYDLGGGVTITDPVNISSTTSGPRVTAGLRLKLAVFTFSGDYTIQKYSTLTAGFGINVR